MADEIEAERMARKARMRVMRQDVFLRAWENTHPGFARDALPHGHQNAYRGASEHHEAVRREMGLAPIVYEGEGSNGVVGDRIRSMFDRRLKTLLTVRHP
jgi:hypothetical protein